MTISPEMSFVDTSISYPSPVKEELNNIQVPDFISRHKDEKRIEPLTADQLKSVSKVLQDEIKWPSQLQKWSAEHFMLADGGANVHVSDNEDLHRSCTYAKNY